jgi:hypothetical protein
MGKQFIAVLLVSVSLSTGIGFAMGSATSPEPADAAASSQVVKQLKQINSKLGAQQQSPGSVRGLLTIICDYTASISCTP